MTKNPIHSAHFGEFSCTNFVVKYYERGELGESNQRLLVESELGLGRKVIG